MPAAPETPAVRETAVDAPHAYSDRELSWLAFARRVLALVEDRDLPLFERVKFAGIMGMLHDEFFMKRMNGLLRQLKQRLHKLSIDGNSDDWGRSPAVYLRALERFHGDFLGS